jgi:S1-C subfamily serine protease
MRFTVNHRLVAICLALSAGLLCVQSLGEATTPPADNAGLSAAICPVVYPLDESSSERGYHYIFYGNAFFIDRDGYLVTAAHVLSDFHNGGQPHIVLRLPEAPPRLLKVEVVASEPQHDIAVLRAVPNPFEGKYQVAFLPLAAGKPRPGDAVLAAALRPSRLRDPHTFDAPQEERSPAEVLQYISTELEKGQAKGELFLFSHEVRRGQSGAPIVSRDSQEVVGIVEGQWLHPWPSSPTEKAWNRPSMPGAAVPIVYAIPLLEQKHIDWQTASAAR